MNPETVLLHLYVTHNSFPRDKDPLKCLVITHIDAESLRCVFISFNFNTSHGQPLPVSMKTPL